MYCVRKRETERHAVDMETKDERVEGKRGISGGDRESDGEMEKMDLETVLGSCRAVRLPRALGDPAPTLKGEEF